MTAVDMSHNEKSAPQNFSKKCERAQKLKVIGIQANTPKTKFMMGIMEPLKVSMCFGAKIDLILVKWKTPMILCCRRCD